MSEIKDLSGYDTAAILLLRAMLWDKEDIINKLRKSHDGKHDTKVEVEFKINGVDYDYTKLVNEIIKINNERVEQLIAEEVKKILQMEKIKEFVYKIDQVETEMEDAIEKLIGKKLPWRDPEYT
jgi:hypothetical protein